MPPAARQVDPFVDPNKQDEGEDGSHLMEDGCGAIVVFEDMLIPSSVDADFEGDKGDSREDWGA